MADCPTELSELTKIKRLNLKRKASTSIASPSKSKKIKSEYNPEEQPHKTSGLPDTANSKNTKYASSVLSLTPSLAYGIPNGFDDSDTDDDLLSSYEGERYDVNLIELDPSLLERDKGVLFSEDLTDDCEIWTCQCSDDININKLQETFLHFSEMLPAKINNSTPNKVDLIPVKNDENTHITLVIPSEETKKLSLNVVPLAGSIIMTNRPVKEKPEKKIVLPVDTIEDATRRRSELMSKIIKRLANKDDIKTTHNFTSIKKEFKIEKKSPKKIMKSSKQKSLN